MSQAGSEQDRSQLPQPPMIYRWAVLFFVSVAMFGNYYVYDSIAPLADVLKEQLGFSDTNIGTLNAIYSLPNIIMVLTDDIGWGELGWQGGGKHRGTPSPALDKMAMEGMRLWSAYAEPSCTPTRIAIMTWRCLKNLSPQP